MAWMRLTYWGVLTPAQKNGIPEALFASEELCRGAVEASREESGVELLVVRVRLEIESIERGES